MKEQNMTQEFKETLALFLKNIGCEDTSKEVIEMETFGDVLETLKDNSEEIVDALKYECTSCDEKDSKIRDLQWDKDSIEDKLEEAESYRKEAESDLNIMEEQMLKSFYPESIDDAYKLQAFLENKDKYSISEFENIFKK